MDDEGRFTAKALHVPEPSAPPAPQLLPIGADLLALLDMRVFGSEERVQFDRTAGGVDLKCAPGSHPAGAVLRWPGYRLPRAMRGSLAIAGEGGEGFGLSPVRPGGDAPQPPTALFERGLATLSLPDEPAELVITCPQERGALRVRHARIVPTPGGEGSYGTWLWDARRALSAPQEFAAHAAAAGLDEIAVQATAEAGHGLVPLANALSDRGLAFRLVEGDPAMVGPAGLARAVARVRALRTAAEGADQDAVLELDIEPYTTPSYAYDSASAWQRWGEAITALAHAWGRSVDVVVPWWMLHRADAVEAMTRAESSIRGVVVMAYRTEPQLILDAAEPWLARGAAYGKPVRIAIEAGQVAMEAQRHYRRADSGPLEILAEEARLHSAPAASTGGGGRFAMVRETIVHPRRISFYGAPDARAAAMDVLLPQLRAWPSFAGFRVHGLELDRR